MERESCGVTWGVRAISVVLVLVAISLGRVRVRGRGRVKGRGRFGLVVGLGLGFGFGFGLGLGAPEQLGARQALELVVQPVEGAPATREAVGAPGQG